MSLAQILDLRPFPDFQKLGIHKALHKYYMGEIVNI